MVRLKHKLTEPPVPPERGVKAATFRLLLDTGSGGLFLVEGGEPDSQVSRVEGDPISNAAGDEFSKVRYVLCMTGFKLF